MSLLDRRVTVLCLIYRLLLAEETSVKVTNNYAGSNKSTTVFEVDMTRKKLAT